MGTYEHLNQNADEIDLRHLALMIIKGKRWIIGSVLVGLALAVASLLVATPVYKASVTFMPAPDGLRMLNKVPEVNYSQSVIQTELNRLLISFDNFNEFVRSEYGQDELIDDLGIQADAQEGSLARKFFFENISFAHPAGDSEDPSSTLNITYSDGLNGSDFINDYFRWTQDKVTQELVSRSEVVVHAAITRNTERMSALQKSYDDEVETRIAQLFENQQLQLLQLQDKLAAEKEAEVKARKERVRALKQAEQIAKRLGITKPTTPRELGRTSGEKEIVYAEINSGGGLPLYFMGTEALQAEREVVEANLDDEVKTGTIRSIEKQIQELQTNRQVEVLRTRDDNSAFIEEYNSLRKQNILLRTNTVSPEDIQIAEVVNWAYHPDSPSSPNTALTLVLAVMLSGMLGLMLVFLIRFSQSLKTLPLEMAKARA